MMTNINNLPREILLHIFSYYLKSETQRNFIRNVANVCQYWEEICLDSSLWHSFDGTLTLNYLKKYSKMGCLKFTKSLVFSYRKKNLTSSELQLIYKNLPLLKCVNFSNLTEKIGKGEWKFFSELFNHCPDLCDITFLETQMIYPPKFPSKMFQNFLNIRGSNLTSLDISNLDVLSLRDLFTGIASLCPNLECLTAQNLRGGSNIFPIQYMQKGLKKLKTLRLGHPILMQNCNSVSASGFQILDTFTHASKNDCCIVDIHLEKVLMNSPHLKVLDIRGCTLISPATLCSLPADNLERLYVSNTRLYELYEFEDVIKKWGHSLIALDVSKMKARNINNLFRSIFSFGCLQNLESLDLNNTGVTVSTIKLIIQNCPKLNFLQLESCRSLGRGCKHPYHGQTEIKQLLNLEDEMEIK